MLQKSIPLYRTSDFIYKSVMIHCYKPWLFLADMTKKQANMLGITPWRSRRQWRHFQQAVYSARFPHAWMSSASQAAWRQWRNWICVNIQHRNLFSLVLCVKTGNFSVCLKAQSGTIFRQVSPCLFDLVIRSDNSLQKHIKERTHLRNM